MKAHGQRELKENAGRGTGQGKVSLTPWSSKGIGLGLSQLTKLSSQTHYS